MVWDMQLPENRENVALSGAEVFEFDRMTTIFEVHEEHLLDYNILTVVYAG